MRLLLDTHALLWALGAPARLPDAAAKAISDPDNEVFASAASIWEIAIKAALGKVSADVDEIVDSLPEAGFDPLDVTVDHARRVRRLPPHHRDPFDRLFVAQSLEEGLVIVTRDGAFAPYKVPTLWV
ncbi:MAG: type II toxin-antitoxin system VapC family toxin [Polyangiaceae bacterium]